MRTARSSSLGVIVACFVSLMLVGACGAAAGDIVDAHQKISDTEGGFTGVLDDFDLFGGSVCVLGDLNGDEVDELVVGADGDDDGGTDRGAVWVLFMNSDGTVGAHQKISDTEGGFTGVLDDEDGFGRSVCSVGDLDSNGVEDLAVGAPGDDDGGGSRGAVWVLFMNSDGTVGAYRKISDTEGGFTGALRTGDEFGGSVCLAGDLDSDEVEDLAVGAPEDDDGGTERGAVWVLFMNSDGTVKTHQKISDWYGGFTGTLDDYDTFGWSVCSAGDLDSDGVEDLAVGAVEDDDGGTQKGAVWVLFMNSDGTVKTHQKISDTEGGFTGGLLIGDHFGSSVCSAGDLDGDGVEDLAVGASSDRDGGLGRGAVWVLFMNPDGTVKADEKVSDTEGGFTGVLDNNDRFGNSVVSLGDLDGDGVQDLAVGAYCDDDGGTNRGAVWGLFLKDQGAGGAPDGAFTRSAYLRSLPNPCHGHTRIYFSMDREQAATLAVYDVHGMLVRNLIHRRIGPGAYSEEWDGSNDGGAAVPSGIYFCRLATDDRVFATRIVVLK